MITIDYSQGIKIETKDIDKVLKEEQLPIKVEIKNVVSKKIVWSTKLDKFMWATFPNNEMYDVIIKDSKDNFIYHYYWDVIQHGSIFYKSLWFYCKSLINTGIKPNGLVIGTHDGEFGEWCPLVRHNMSEMVLVEGSKKQFDQLVDNYSGKVDLTFINEIITTDGKDVVFFEGGKGYTNSTIERVINNWETEKIESSVKKSVSINELIETYFVNKKKKLDWIHLDVEGLDAKLILSIKEEYLPNFIIFEDANLLNDEKNELMYYLTNKGYSNNSENGICMSTIN